jgi:hypothetical protein
MWNQWRRRDKFMSLIGEIFQKGSSYIIGGLHDFDLGEQLHVYNPD